MALFKNNWLSKLTGKSKKAYKEEEAAELAAKETAEKLNKRCF